MMKHIFTGYFISRIAILAVSAVLIWLCADIMRPDAKSMYVETAASGDSGSYGMTVPAAVRNFEMNLRYENGSEIVKHYDVRGKGENAGVYGYVQVWKTDQSLEHYLKISREYVYGFREEDIKINGQVWKKWEYIVNDTAAAQGFYEKNGEITIVSLCVPYREKTYAFDKMFSELIESVIA